METKFKAVAGVVIALLVVAAVVAFPAAAAANDRIAKWDGWTYDQSVYEPFTPEWVQDVKEHVYPVITEKGKSFTDRAKAQCYMLGWDDRIDIADQYGTFDYDAGTITYDFGFWGNIFGVGVDKDKLFYTIEEYDAVVDEYSKVYSACVQPVPREV